MRDGMPMALVNGIGKIGASCLVEKLAENDIKVIAVGEFESRLSLLQSVVMRDSCPSDLSGIDYVFDFLGDHNIWMSLVGSETKLMVLGVNGEDVADLRELGDKVNWRIVRAHGVIGRGVNFSDSFEEVAFLVRAMELAVRNLNLVMPGPKAKLRLLGEMSFVDVVMRAMFLSSTSGNVYDVWGEQIDSVTLAGWLIDEAKMTRNKVMEGDEVVSLIDSGVVNSEWDRLRWRPGDDLKNAIAQTLQYFFAKADEENRKPKVAISKADNLAKQEVVSIASNKMFEVMVDTGEDFETEKKIEIAEKLDDGYQQKEVDKIEVKIKEDVAKVESKVLVENKLEDRNLIVSKLMEEEFGKPQKKVVEEKPLEITPFLLKNSNRRMVKSFEDKPIGILEKEKLILRDKPKVVKVEKPVQESLKIDDIGDKKKWWYVSTLHLSIAGGLLIMVVLSMLGWWGYGNYKIVKNTYGVGDLVNSKKYDEADKVVVQTLADVRNNELLVEKWQLNRWIWGRRYQDSLRLVEQALRLESEAVVLAKKVELLSDGMFKDKEVDWKKELGTLKVGMEDLRSTLAMLSARMSGDWSWIPNRWRGDFNDAREKVQEMNGIIVKVAKAVDILPELLGTDGKRREFLVLLQNESEIRPGGGFIGSYGILSFENGKLLNFEISDIYEADGQLKGHVEPPAAIKKYLGEAKWYMRDANWQADFGMSAKDLQWFLEKETGRKVDGVIGVDLAVAKSILGVTGEIYVPDFKEKINKNNLYEQAEFYSETKFFPGSKQKASFLGGLGRQLFEEIKNLKGEQRMKMVVALVDMLERNELQMVFSNDIAAKVTNDLGWSGAVYEGKCAVERCFADYLYIVEANLGVNKANYFLYRSIDQTVDIGTQTIGRVVKITYENTAKNNSWPGGDYKNYMRMYIPASANIAEVSVTDIEANGMKTIYSGENLTVETAKGKKEIGFLVVVPAGKKRMVEVRYVDQVDLTNKDKFSYLHYIQRQPGYGDTGMVTLVTLPSGWQINQVEPAASMVGEKLLFNQKLDRDIKMGVEINK